MNTYRRICTYKTSNAQIKLNALAAVLYQTEYSQAFQTNASKQQTKTLLVSCWLKHIYLSSLNHMDHFKSSYKLDNSSLL